MLTFYKGYDNSRRLQLTEDDVAQDLTAVTKVELTFNGTTYDSDTSPDVFDWETNSMYLELKCGLIPNVAVTKDKKAEVVTYDPSHPNGFVWGRVYIKIDEVT